MTCDEFAGGESGDSRPAGRRARARLPPPKAGLDVAVAGAVAKNPLLNVGVLPPGGLDFEHSLFHDGLVASAEGRVPDVQPLQEIHHLIRHVRQHVRRDRLRPRGNRPHHLRFAVDDKQVCREDLCRELAWSREFSVHLHVREL